MVENEKFNFNHNYNALYFEMEEKMTKCPKKFYENDLSKGQKRRFSSKYTKKTFSWLILDNKVRVMAKI